MAEIVVRREDYNLPDFEPNRRARFFVIEAQREGYVRKSLKYRLWASSPDGNKKLDAAFREKHPDSQIFLFFSVDFLEEFIGVAEMVGPVDFDHDLGLEFAHDLEFWPWNGCFPVTWHIVKDVPKARFGRNPVGEHASTLIRLAKDTQEVDLRQGNRCLKYFKMFNENSSLLDYFDHLGRLPADNSILLYNPKRWPSDKDAEYVAILRRIRGRPLYLIQPPFQKRRHVELPKVQIKLPSFLADLDKAKFFAIKAQTVDDIRNSLKYNVWASTPDGIKKLNTAFREKDPDCPVFLFFLVHEEKFIGVAEMIGQVDLDDDMESGQPRKGCFAVAWRILKGVPYSRLKHVDMSLILTEEPHEVGMRQGVEMLDIIKSYPKKAPLSEEKQTEMGDTVSVFIPALKGMKNVKSESGEILSDPFLHVCKNILPVIDKFGAFMADFKSDVGGYIARLDLIYNSNRDEFNCLYSMVHCEVEAKTAEGSSSCTSGLLWLTRSMDFLVELFRNLLEHPDWSISQAYLESYSKTLKEWSGQSAAMRIVRVMRLVPDRKTFMGVIGGSGDVMADIEKFCTTVSPLLEENHKFLASVGMDALRRP